jgi:uncharacterized protein (DUF2236 family)
MGSIARDVVTKKIRYSRHSTGQGFFSSDMMIWQVHREAVLLAAGGRALLMQIAHPKVAAGVAEHSSFKEDPLGRLQRTTSALWSILFDEESEARASLEQVKNIHRKVRGTTQAGEPLPTGSSYSALDADLLLWVHATLIDSAMTGYDLLVKPLTADEKSRYYIDSKKLASLFEIPDSIVPASLTDFHGYMTRMLAEDKIAVGPAARAISKDILHPRPWILRPAGPLFALITAGMLPERLRQGYGLIWTERREKRFVRAAKWFQRLLPFVPRSARIVPNARSAENQRQVRDS